MLRRRRIRRARQQTCDGEPRHITAEELENAICAPEHVGTEQIGPFLSALEALQAEPANEALLSRMITDLKTGAPPGRGPDLRAHIGLLMSDDLFSNSY